MTRRKRVFSSLGIAALLLGLFCYTIHRLVKAGCLWPR